MGISERQSGTTNTREPLLDQHISLVASAPLSIWLLPLGVLAVTLRFYEPITEYVDLVAGLLKNIINSILGKSNCKIKPVSIT